MKQGSWNWSNKASSDTLQTFKNFENFDQLILMLSMSVQYDAQFYIATMLRPWYSCAATPISQSDVSENYCNAQVAGRQQ